MKGKLMKIALHYCIMRGGLINFKRVGTLHWRRRVGHVDTKMGRFLGKLDEGGF